MSRTQDEIVARIRGYGNTDFFGFKIGLMIGYLDFDHAKEFLKPEVSASEWEISKLDDEAIVNEMREYVVFAFDKIEGHRGISSVRSVQKLAEWAWLVGRDDVSKVVASEANYAPYGAPAIAHLCKEFGFDIPRSTKLDRMVQGLSCVPNCDEGCGS